MNMHESWNEERGLACGGKCLHSASSSLNEAKGRVCVVEESQNELVNTGDTDKLDCLINSPHGKLRITQ